MNRSGAEHMSQDKSKMEYLLVTDGVKARGLNPLSVAVQAHVTQHHDGAEQQGCRVRQVLPCDIRSSSMDLTGKFHTQHSMTMNIHLIQYKTRTRRGIKS